MHNSLATPHRRTLELGAGLNPQRLDVVTGEFAGRVLDAIGRPLADIRVLARAVGERFGPAQRLAPLTTTDARGEFVLAGLEVAAALA